MADNTRSISVSGAMHWRISEAARARDITMTELVELALGDFGADGRPKKGPPRGSRHIPISEQLKARFSRWCQAKRASRIQTADEIINAAIDAAAKEPR